MNNWISKRSISKGFRNDNILYICPYSGLGGMVIHMGKTMERLIDSIHKLKGNKMVTLTDKVSRQGFRCIFSENGKIGEDAARESLFKTKTLDAMNCGGGIVVRQHTDINIDKLYGIRLQNKKWSSVSAEEMEIIHCTDIRTGKRIPKGDVRFGSL